MRVDGSEDETRVTLRHGSSDQKGTAILDLARQKNPQYNDLLRDIMNSGDPYLSAMAAFALGESGDQEGLPFLQKLFGNLASALPGGDQNIGVVKEVLELPDVMDRALDSYNRSYFVEAREKLLQALGTFSMDVPRMGVAQFDELAAYSCKKTTGLIYAALSVCEFDLGNIETALQYASDAISIGQEVGDPQVLKIAYVDLAHINIALGNYYTALNLLQESLVIDDSSRDPWRKRNRAVSKLAQLHYLVGQHERSLEYVEEGLDLARPENDTYGLARALNMKGLVLGMMDDPENAGVCFREALDLSVNELRDRSFQGTVLNNLACLVYSLSDMDEAKLCLEEALELSLEMGDSATETTVRTNLALFALNSDDIVTAKREALKALRQSEEMRDQTTQSDACFILGLIAEHHEDATDQAYGYYEKAITLSESLRKNLMLDDFKVSFADCQAGVYQHMVALCARTGRTEEAFEYIERSKSRALVDIMSQTMDAVAPKEAGEKCADGGVEELRDLKARLNLLKKRIGSAHLTLIQGGQSKRDEALLSTSVAEGGLGGFSEDESDQALLEELNDLEHAYERAFEALKTKDPEWTSLQYTESVDLKTAQQAMVDEDTLLLDFYQADNEVVAILAKSEGQPSMVSIPVDSAKLSEDITALFSALTDGSTADVKSHNYVREVRIPLARLFDLILRPIAAQLEGIRRLIISPHGMLHYLPFHALYDETTKEYLVDRFIVSYAPSVTALNLCQLKNAALAGKKGRTALILANSAGDLKYAENEAQMIGARFDSKSATFSKADASFDNLVGHSDADIIHIACHGYFRSDNPLFSHIVLADEDGEATPFYLPDIFNLRLNTSLVVLSGCETGLGQFTGGDELIGMSRAFFYAGTPSLLSSLWTVDDKSTSMLMERFYEVLLETDRGKADALAEAMRHLKATPEYAHPYYWAPFFLSGDYL